MRATAVILFAGESRREGWRKGLPGPFLNHLHEQIASTIRSLEAIDFFIADELAPGSEPLGAKVSRVVANGFAGGYRRVVLVAGDLPALSRKILERAIASDGAIGRSSDGGFYIVAVTPRFTIDWSSVRWCSPHAFDDLAAALGSVDILPELDDIDSLADALRVLRAPKLAALYCRLLSLIRRPNFTAHKKRLPARAAARGIQLRAPPVLA